MSLKNDVLTMLQLKNGEYISGQELAEIRLYRKYTVTAEYPDSGKVQYEILQGGHELYNIVYTHQVEFTVLAEIDNADAFEKKMTEIFRGKQMFEPLGEVYGVWKEGTLRLIE